MPDEAENPHRDRSSSESDGDSGDSVPVESLVAGRAKRSAAGNRYSSLLQAEIDKDDDVALLFAEDEEEEDHEFQGDGEADASDVQLESSSDDDDQGPTAGADGLEGEAELQQQDRAERRKKRKAQEMFRRPRSSLKKVKYDPTATTSISTPPPRPKKKSERTSWIPTPDQGPTRSSQRKQTVLNKEVTHLRLQESEVRRRQTIKAMEEAAKKKEASKPKAMTQEDRLAEAARVEKANEKSLTKWEENEKKRVEEQKARLAALHNRQLKGPVITWWSGPARWVDETLTDVGSTKIREKGAEGDKDGPDEKSSSKGQLAIREKSLEAAHAPAGGRRPLEAESAMQNHPQAPESVSSASKAPIPDTFVPPRSQSSANLPTVSEHAQQRTTNTLPSQVYSVPTPRPQQEFDGYYSGPVASQTVQVVVPRSPLDPSTTSYVTYPPPPTAPARPPTPVVEIASRNLVALRNVDLNHGTEARAPELHDHVLLLAKKPTKGPGKQAHAATAASKAANGKGAAAHGRQQVPCAITGQHARYRDPVTGLAYVDAAAYREIQKLRAGRTRWSASYGCYTGPAVGAARGVPERFVSS